MLLRDCFLTKRLLHFIKQRFKLVSFCSFKYQASYKVSKSIYAKTATLYCYGITEAMQQINANQFFPAVKTSKLQHHSQQQFIVIYILVFYNYFLQILTRLTTTCCEVICSITMLHSSLIIKTFVLVNANCILQ